MIPKISVSPLATRNNNSPYCTLLSTWIRKIGRSIKVSRCNKTPRGPALLRPSNAAGQRVVNLSELAHRATAPGIGQRLCCKANGLVLAVLDLAQIEVLHHVVRRRERDLAARAVDLCGSHRAGQQCPLRDVAIDRTQSDTQQLRRIVALDRVDVRLAAIRFGVGEPEGGVARCVEIVGVVQRGEQALGSRALRIESPVGEKARSEQRNLVLESRSGVILDELDCTAASEECVRTGGLDRCD